MGTVVNRDMSLNITSLVPLNEILPIINDEEHPCPDKSMLTSMRFKGRQPGLDLIILTRYIYNKHNYCLLFFLLNLFTNCRKWSNRRSA